LKYAHPEFTAVLAVEVTTTVAVDCPAEFVAVMVIEVVWLAIFGRISRWGLSTELAD
jgi:hypothetical protein